MRRFLSRFALAVVAFAAAMLTGQRAEAQPMSRVEGVAFDSITGRPFVGALVTVRGTTKSAFTDARGQFVLDSLPQGRYRLDLSDPAIENRGLGDISNEVLVDAAVTRTAIAFPSFGTVARRLCSSVPLPNGSETVLVGVVRDARTERALSGAVVEITGSDIVSDIKRATTIQAVHQRRWAGKAVTDSTGTYALCGVPQDVPVAISARHDRMSMTDVESTLSARTIIREDLWLALDDETAVGVVSGVVIDAESQKPVADVQVTIGGTESVRTNSQGQYRVNNSPLGTREMEFKRVGVAPVRRRVDVRTGRTSIVNIELQRLTRLDAVRIATISPRQQRILDMERRRDLGFGYFADSTNLLRYPGLAEAVRLISDQKSVCAVYVDGMKQQWEDVVRDYKPHMIAQLEVQTRFTPIEYQQRRPHCPVILLWTKAGQP